MSIINLQYYYICVYQNLENHEFKSQLIFDQIISNMSYNFLVKQLGELKEGKKSRDSKYETKINLEDLLYRIQLHSVKANLQRVKITQEEFVGLCRGVKRQTISQPGLLKIDGPIYVCTGTLGNYQELAKLIDKCGHPKFVNYLFLGDYTGSYDQSIQCLVALFAYKLFMPNNFFLLRGCHQTISLANAYTLQAHLKQFFHSSRPWLEVCQTFCSLPYAALVEQKIFCVHGGLSPSLQSLDQINRIPRPLDCQDKGISCDLIWSDPTNLHEGWTENQRGISYSFGSDIVSGFLKNHDLSLICRGHEVAFNGFKFFADKKMVTITSLSSFCGITNNSSAVLVVDQQSNVLFKQITEKNNYSGNQQQQDLTFIDFVQRKKEREQKREKQDEQQRKTKTRKTRQAHQRTKATNHNLK